MRRLGWLVPLALLAGLAGCDDDREVTVTGPDGETYEIERRDGVERDLERKLDRLEEQIERLSARVTDASRETADDLRRQIRELEDEKATLRLRLKELKAAGKEAWRDVLKGVESGLERLENAVGEARRKVD